MKKTYLSRIKNEEKYIKWEKMCLTSTILFRYANGKYTIFCHHFLACLTWLIWFFLFFVNLVPQTFVACLYFIYVWLEVVVDESLFVFLGHVFKRWHKLIIRIAMYFYIIRDTQKRFKFFYEVNQIFYELHLLFVINIFW